MAQINATVTAKIGPGNQATAMSLVGCRDVSFDVARNVFSYVDSSGRHVYFDYQGVTTITSTVSSGNIAQTVS